MKRKPANEEKNPYNPKTFAWFEVENEYLRGLESMAGLIGMGDAESTTAVVKFIKETPEAFRPTTDMVGTRLFAFTENEAALQEMKAAGLGNNLNYGTEKIGEATKPELERWAYLLQQSEVYAVRINADSDPLHGSYTMPTSSVFRSLEQKITGKPLY